jgi:methylated-DNA-[protein]-cysteine S-methyltransferase
MNTCLPLSRLTARAALPTPLGPMTALVTGGGLAALWFDGEQRWPLLDQLPQRPGDVHVHAARLWLDAYWAGDDPSGIEVTLDMQGTSFQQSVWSVLRSIPYGQTLTYGAVAGRVGPRAVARATGSACGANPVGVIVPCHRVIGANGSLTGFAGGLHRKEKLLAHEGALLL